MQALILAAGPCTRLRPHTDEKHKCLVEVQDGVTILDTELHALRENGITDIVVTVGHCAEGVQQYIATHHKDLDITFVENPEYAQTNCIYSTWLAKDVLKDDLFFLTGDLVFGPEVIEQMIHHPAQNVMYTNTVNPLPEKDFKARVKDGKVVEIGLDVFGEDAHYCWPLYRFSKESWNVWMMKMDEYIRNGVRDVYSEVAFNEIPEQINLSPSDITDFCNEVDNEEDLEVVRKHLT